ncbi:hypothetical protein KK083_28550 [Fulvivirgaceae bacterium PWU4]|uniref:Uncharacterized protein n=1 Tax=Chryseosolibacter histidini TaxID=2782349 RepID=A0AAP2DQW0_9BACT|nr:hypothetical protein [Chryseosolibacter histidini]MBT1700876.1 hypothetical protein [Chryseosolibacter histidini]
MVTSCLLPVAGCLLPVHFVFIITTEFLNRKTPKKLTALSSFRQPIYQDSERNAVLAPTGHPVTGNWQQAPFADQRTKIFFTQSLNLKPKNRLPIQINRLRLAYKCSEKSLSAKIRLILSPGF